jgi:RHS repeat-associated protein
VIDSAGVLTNREEFAPYGETTFGSFTRKRYRFTGKERDEENGLSYHGARYYAPWLGKWMNPDPAGFKDSPNLYQYVLGNPLRLTDPSGMGSVGDLIVGVTGAGSAKAAVDDIAAGLSEDQRQGIADNLTAKAQQLIPKALQDPLTPYGMTIYESGKKVVTDYGDNYHLARSGNYAALLQNAPDTMADLHQFEGNITLMVSDIGIFSQVAKALPSGPRAVMQGLEDITASSRPLTRLAKSPSYVEDLRKVRPDVAKFLPSVTKRPFAGYMMAIKGFGGRGPLPASILPHAEILLDFLWGRFSGFGPFTRVAKMLEKSGGEITRPILNIMMKTARTIEGGPRGEAAVAFDILLNAASHGQ